MGRKRAHRSEPRYDRWKDREERERAEKAAQSQTAPLAAFSPPGQETRSDLRMMATAMQNKATPDAVRQAILARSLAFMERIAGHEEQYPREMVRLLEIAQTDQKLAMEAIQVQIEIEKFERGDAETQINVTQQTAVNVSAAARQEVIQDMAAMDASMLPPSKVYQQYGLADKPTEQPKEP